MKNIHTLATDNTTPLASLHNQLQTPATTAFCDFLRAHMEFSISRLRGMVQDEALQKKAFSEKPSISWILQSGRYYSPWELNPDKDPDFGEFTRVRVSFDDSFTNGRKFKYMAVIAGTTGLPHFGDVSLIFDPETFTEEDLVVLKQDSLCKCPTGHYYFDEYTLNTERLGNDLATKKNVSHLIVVKLSSEIEDCAAANYKHLLFRAQADYDDYLEVITWQDIHLEKCLKAIRMKKEYYQVMDRVIRQNAFDPDDDPNDPALNNLKEFYNLLKQKRSNKTMLQLITTSYD